jgi:hypothetical protein
VATAAGHRPSHLRRSRHAVALVPDPDSVASHTLPYRGGRRGPTPCPHRWPTCGRRPDTVRASDRRGHRHGHRHQPAKCAGHQPSGEWSLERPFPKQRTVNPLVPARDNFLYSPQGRPCGRPAAALRPGNDTTAGGGGPHRQATQDHSSPAFTALHSPAGTILPARAAPQASGPGVPARARHAHEPWRPAPGGRDVPAARPPAHAS